MSLEAAIQANTEALKALVVAIGSAFAAGQMATATLAEVGTQSTDKKEEKKAETKKAETKKADATAPAPAAAEVKWATVLDAIKRVNASKEAGHGREGVEKILKQFGKDGQKVPALESLNKHAEVLAFTESVLAGEAAADEGDDLGI